jgi:single-stranded-DNA-specific exonuclease
VNSESVTQEPERRQRLPAKRWTFPSTDPAAIDELARSAKLPRLIAGLLVARGIKTPEAASQFLSPTINDLHAPAEMLGMEGAVARLQQAIAAKETVLIYGDYDVDGTVATVLLKTAIEILGGTARYHIPHRMTEGYGMQSDVLSRAKDEGVGLVVSVDTGIRAHAASERARQLGLDLIVTDHHLPDPLLGTPHAIAVLNPNQRGCGYPNKSLCGAGVAFKLAQALLEAADLERARKVLIPSFLKVVAIATIADAVPLLGENRVIVSLGLRELRRPINPGLRALMACAQLDPSHGKMTATDIAFRLAPRINAAGRMDIASDVVELLTTRDVVRAEALAQKLHQLNDDRRGVEQEIVAAMEALLAADATLEDAALLVLDGQGWHRGVLGIAASRVVDRMHRPTLVIGHEGFTGNGSATDGEAHGSGRSISNFHLLDAITTCADLFTRYGGHAHAVGFSLPIANIAPLRDRLMLYAAERLSAEDRIPELRCAAELPLDEITPALFTWLAKMEPLGMGNPGPLFVANNVEVASAPRKMKERHIRLRLSNGGRGPGWNAVGWNMAELLDSLEVVQGSRIDVVFRIRENEHPEFGGLELELVDLRRTQSAN